MRKRSVGAKRDRRRDSARFHLRLLPILYFTDAISATARVARLVVCVGIWSALAAPTAADVERRGCEPLDLPTLRTEAPPTQYARFCAEMPGECEMTGSSVVNWTPDVKLLVSSVNREVNAEIRFASDMACHGQEEVWSYPVGGYGDCEGFALEKRRRLVAAGLSRAAITMAIAHHEEALFPHAVLLLETSEGSLLLDNLDDAVVCWDRPPYDFERRDLPDGRWVRFLR